MDARAIITKIRDGILPSNAELQWFAHGLADGSVSDAQGGAFAMATLLRGIGDDGRVALTRAMRDSGKVLNWGLDAPVLDKHSTGGIGDCVSLLLAPALADCGAYVPMISGRGLGHTGGTLDKMEAIPGVSVNLSEQRFRQIVIRTGHAIVSASAEIAPADRRLYAIRDVTGTVESLDLITASILSKKLAAGLDGLVLDVKVGSGAFMKTADDARALAQSLVDTANLAGCPTTALITDMNQPLVPSVGNALEVSEVMRALTDSKPSRLLEVTKELGGELLARAGLVGQPKDGVAKIEASITSGRAADRFGRMIAALGGPLDFVENWQKFLPEAPVIREVIAQEAGYVSTIDGMALGLSVVKLGGGREVEGDRVHPAVGLSQVAALGQPVERGQVLARVHAAREEQADEAKRTILEAITIGHRVNPPTLIMERIS